MKITLVDQKRGQTRTVVLKGWLRRLLSLCLLGAPVAMGCFGYQLALSGSDFLADNENSRAWEQGLRHRAQQLDLMLEESRREIEALTVRLALLKARAQRNKAGVAIATAQLNDEKADGCRFPHFSVDLVNGYSRSLPALPWHQCSELYQSQTADKLQQFLTPEVPNSFTDYRISGAALNLPCGYSNLHTPVKCFKNGRVVDPAAYLHRTAS